MAMQEINLPQVVRQEYFEGMPLNIIEHEGQEWLTAQDIGEALEFQMPRLGVLKIFQRNQKEFPEPNMTCVVNLTTQVQKGKDSGEKGPGGANGKRSQARRVRVFNWQGTVRLCFLAKTPRSMEMQWWILAYLERGHQQGRYLSQVVREIIPDLEETRRVAGGGNGQARRALPPPDDHRVSLEARISQIEAQQSLVTIFMFGLLARLQLPAPQKAKKKEPGESYDAEHYQEFIRERTRPGEQKNKITAEEIFKVYQGWCKEKGLTPGYQRPLGIALGEAKYVRDKGTNGIRIWRGLIIRKKSNGHGQKEMERQLLEYEGEEDRKRKAEKRQMKKELLKISQNELDN